MNEIVKKFIEQNIDLIGNNEWEMVFLKALDKNIAVSLFDDLIEADVDCFSWSGFSEDSFYDIIGTLEDIRHGNQRWPGGHINKDGFNSDFSEDNLNYIAKIAKNLNFDIYKYIGKRIPPYEDLTYILINPGWTIYDYLDCSSDTLFDDIEEENIPTPSDFKHMEVI